jgi:GT2 family glycosyltransferase
MTGSSLNLTVVLPTRGDQKRLGRSLPRLCEALVALRARAPEAGEAEIVVVDDSGVGAAAAALPEILATLDRGSVEVSIRTVCTERSLGFGPAVMRGARDAVGAHLLVLHDDVLVDADGIAALLDVLHAEPTIFAAAPTLLRPAAPDSPPDSPPARVPARVVLLEDDWLRVREDSEASAGAASVNSIGGQRAVDVEVIPSAAVLVRRGEFLDLGGFDRLFGPATLEDVDLSMCARRRGRRLVEVLGAEALHLDLGDGLGELLEAPAARALVARNRLLLRWKHLSTRTDAADHLVGLWRTALEAGLTGDRETLEGIALAMDRLGEMAESRATLRGVAPMEL